MLKLMGAILLTAGATLWGFSGVKSLREKVRGLSALTASLELMGYELCCMLRPVPDLFKLLSQQAPKPACRLFQNAYERLKEIGAVTFSEIWHESICDTKELMLSDQEVLVLSELGLYLGKYDVQEQRKAIENAINQFKAFTKKAEEERDKNWKSQAFLGVAAGIFAVIILL